MKIRLLVVGKTSVSWLEEGMGVYRNRLDHYCDFSIDVIPDIRNAGTMDKIKLMHLEAKEITKRLRPGELLLLLDENGRQFTSEDFAERLNKWMVAGNRSIAFVIGGAFGIDPELKQKADFILSLSEMTFSHQLIRVIFLEQLYRAFTILKNEPYHHR